MLSAKSYFKIQEDKRKFVLKNYKYFKRKELLSAMYLSVMIPGATDMQSPIPDVTLIFLNLYLVSLFAKKERNIRPCVKDKLDLIIMKMTKKKVYCISGIDLRKNK